MIHNRYDDLTKSGNYIMAWTQVVVVQKIHYVYFSNVFKKRQSRIK